MLRSGSATAAATSSECRTWKCISGGDPTELKYNNFATISLQHPQNVEHGNVSLEEIQRNPRHLCACASAAGLRRHCDILGRMVRESDTSLGSNNYPLLHVAQKFLFCRNDSDAKMPLRKLIDNG